MWLGPHAAVPELATSATAPAAVARARRVAFIGRDSRKPSWMAATADVRTGSGKSRRGDSTPRPTTYEAVALPLSYSGGAVRIPAPKRLSWPCGMMRRCPWRRRDASTTCAAAATIIAAAALASFPIVIALVRHDGGPIGADTPVYVWWARLVGVAGS